jgi:hypothetical protein
MRLRALIGCTALACFIGLAAFPGAAVSDPATLSFTWPGTLIGVGPHERSLLVHWVGDSGCAPAAPAPTVTAQAVEGPNSVAVTVTVTFALTEPPPPTNLCAGVGLSGTAVATLNTPLAGRTVTGVAIQNGGIQATFVVGPGSAMMPNLVGLSPHQARLMMSNWPGSPPGSEGLGGVVARRIHRREALPVVVAQKPQAGMPLWRADPIPESHSHHRPTVVVLTVAG